MLGAALGSAWLAPRASDGCSFLHNASWSTAAARDPDASYVRPTGQLGACTRTASAQACCAHCAETLGCLAWTFASSRCDVPYLPRSLIGAERCCLQMHLPRHRARPAAGCVAGELLASPCSEWCRLPTPLHAPDHEPLPLRIANASHFPWLQVQQQLQRAQRSPPPPAAPAPPSRVAVCIAGTPRSLLHPTVWRSLEHRVLGRTRGPHAQPGLDAFAVLSTGIEDSPHAAAQAARSYTSSAEILPRSQWGEAFAWRAGKQPLQAGSWEQPDGYAELLGRALSALRPLAVRLRTQSERLSCGLPSTAQFGRWADCVELIEEYEARLARAAPAPPVPRGALNRAPDSTHQRVPPFRYDAMLKVGSAVRRACCRPQRCVRYFPPYACRSVTSWCLCLTGAP